MYYESDNISDVVYCSHCYFEERELAPAERTPEVWPLRAVQPVVPGCSSAAGGWDESESYVSTRDDSICSFEEELYPLGNLQHLQVRRGRDACTGSGVVEGNVWVFGCIPDWSNDDALAGPISVLSCRCTALSA